MTRRGTRIVTGYVVSLSGKKGGPYAYGGRYKYADDYAANMCRDCVGAYNPAARVLPVVRYELDREEERLRDAVVEASVSWFKGSMTFDVFDAVRALRAHLEKQR